MEQGGDLLLDVQNLQTQFSTGGGIVRAVDGVSWDVRAGETVALVGESGCGKSVSALSIMRLISAPAGRILGGRIFFKGRDLLQLPEDEMRQIRGREIAMIFQEPMTSLNPVLTIGRQLTEGLEIHLGMTAAAARTRAAELLAMVGIPDPARRLAQYPHQFSGGMRQRMMIAMALACDPGLILADEPTTALDVTIQAQILELMKRLQRDYGSSILLITHDMGVVSDLAERVTVMYAGSVVEEGPTASVFRDRQHPYTWGLLGSIPRVGRPRVRRLAAIPGAPPSLLAPPEGCRFAPRCRHRFDKCSIRPELLERVASGRADACHLDPAARPLLRLDQESA